MDAQLAVEIVDGTITVVVEARGGGRNQDYNLALELLLMELKAMSAVIVRVEVDSKVSRRLPPAERILEINGRAYPIAVDGVPDIPEFRLAIGAAQRRVAQVPGARGGNRNKRIRIFLGGVNETSLSHRMSLLDGRHRPFSGSAGRLRDAAARSAVEAHAVNKATAFFKARGWNVDDVGLKRLGYDLLLWTGSDERFAEVKGTTSAGDAVEVTAGEVAFSKANSERSVLAVVSNIELEETSRGWQTRGGELRIWAPWRADAADLRPVAYRWPTISAAPAGVESCTLSPRSSS